MAISSPPSGFHGPVKRSVTIAGHATSISLEPVFWHALEAAARGHGLPLSALVAQVDALRIAASDYPNLASALRCWVLAQATGASPSTNGDDHTITRILRNSVDSANGSQ